MVAQGCKKLIYYVLFIIIKPLFQTFYNCLQKEAEIYSFPLVSSGARS